VLKAESRADRLSRERQGFQMYAVAAGAEVAKTPGRCTADETSHGGTRRVAACAGASVQGLVPDLADFWMRQLIAARDRFTGHRPGRHPRCEDAAQVLTQVRRYVMPGLRADPAGSV
jgi:hypothetical protein